MGVGITDLSGVGPVMAQRLEAAGFGTVEAIAAASNDELRTIPGVGESLATRLRAEAQAAVGGGSSSGLRLGTANVAKSVKRLRRDIPDIAKSKKQKKRLRASTKLLTGWVEDLGVSSVRERFLDEVSTIADEAKKRAGSKKRAKRLRKHTTKIEEAVEEVR